MKTLILYGGPYDDLLLPEPPNGPPDHLLLVDLAGPALGKLVHALGIKGSYEPMGISDNGKLAYVFLPIND